MRLNDKAMRRVAMVSLGLTGIALAAPAAAIVVYVRAAPYTETMPDGSVRTMWGYRVGPTRANVISNAPVSPGAAIRVPDNDTTLTVRLINSLPVPTSFVLHGHNATMTPVFTTAAGAVCTPPMPGTTAPDMTALQAFRDCRVRSFTKEAAPRTPQNIGTASLDVEYTYDNVKPGTYLYQSGTMPQIQVQMGLYGVVRKDASPPGTPGRSAYPGIVYDNDITLLLSEVDPAVHDAVAAGTFTGSTLAYYPKFFRLHRYNATGNNCPASNGTVNVSNCITPPELFTEGPGRGTLTISPGGRQLVRVVNAGIQPRALQLVDGHWHLIAEDGNRFPYPREQYSAFLPAAKTADLWFTPTLGANGNAQLDRQLTIYDRRLALTNNNADPSGGQLIRLNVSAGGSVPNPPNVSNCAAQTGTQGTAFACTVTTAGNVQSPTFSLDQAPAGMTINATSGAIAWTPNNDQAWKPLLNQVVDNPVQVRVTSGSGRYNTSTFRVAVTNVNDAPVAANDGLGVRGGTATFPVSALLANDSDPDGDPLGAFTIVAPLAGLTNNGNGTLTYTGSIPASVAEARTFTYQVSDGVLSSNAATVTLTVFPNSAPVAVDDVIARSFFASTETFIDVLANDFDVDGNLAPATLAIVGPPNRGGTAAVVTTGCPVAGRPCISYTHSAGFRGTEAITYQVLDSLNAVSNGATVRVNVE